MPPDLWQFETNGRTPGPDHFPKPQHNRRNRYHNPALRHHAIAALPACAAKYMCYPPAGHTPTSTRLPGHRGVHMTFATFYGPHAAHHRLCLANSHAHGSEILGCSCGILAVSAFSSFPLESLARKRSVLRQSGSDTITRSV